MRVGIKSGCWTLFHKGHVWCLQQCAKQCDYLIVLTNEDPYIMSKKGNVPIPMEDRIYILNHIVGVDEVGHFPEPTEDRWVRDFVANRLHEFGSDAKLVVFHSDELKERHENGHRVPGQGVADEIIFIDKVAKPESVSRIYNEIRR